MTTQSESTPFQRHLAALLGARARDRPSLATMEQQLRRLLATETAPSMTEPDYRTTIEREQVVAAVALLGFDTTKLIEVLLTPTHVSASLLSKGSMATSSYSHSLRIVDTKQVPTIATGDPDAAARDEGF